MSQGLLGKQQPYQTTVPLSGQQVPLSGQNVPLSSGFSGGLSSEQQRQYPSGGQNY